MDMPLLHRVVFRLSYSRARNLSVALAQRVVIRSVLFRKLVAIMRHPSCRTLSEYPSLAAAVINTSPAPTPYRSQAVPRTSSSRGTVSWAFV